MGRLLGVSLIWAAMVVAQLQGFQGCVEEERVGLLALSPMKGINTSSDCCLWRGVSCNATTGRVERLSLFELRFYDGFLNISLFLPFQELLVLDLSYCYFPGLLHLADFVKIRSLKYLDIGYNLLNINLQDVCKMNNIIELNLGHNNITGPLPDCVGNMTELQFLNLDNNMLSGNIPPTIGKLSHLRYLSLTDNYFEGSFSLISLANNSKLVYLDLSNQNNNFQLETETPTWFPSFQLKVLRLSNLSLNKLSLIPSFLLHQYDLRDIELSHNRLEGSFPSWLLQNNSELSRLSLSENFLTGNLILPDFIHVLRTLDISSNKIDGQLPDEIGLFLPRLFAFNISRNRFEDNLPSSLGELQVLSYIDFSFNNFSGELPKNLFARSIEMEVINLSNNRLRGKISLNFTNLPSLEMVMLNNNEFNGTIEDESIEDGLVGTYIGRLLIFDISNNMISGRLPSWIKRFPQFRVLKVSNNYLEGDIPVELCETLYYLDISRNKFSGSIPYCFSNSSLKSLSLRENNFSGAIPDGFLNNFNLVSLDLSYNNFSNRVLPNWIYSLPNIQILLMAGMQLEGEISMQLCTLENIKIMDLSHNHFNGSIPSCLFESPFWIADIPNDFGLGDFKISFPLSAGSSLRDYLINSTLIFYMFEYTSMESLERYEAEFTTKGLLLSYQKDLLVYMTGLDLSNNKLSGKIPTQIEYSQTLHSLNLSSNQLWGSIPNNISKMKDLESLDLSSNNLSGEIPSDVVHLKFISKFNVSNNNLSGPIPNKGQFSTFDEWSYKKNEYLCGPILHRNCTSSAPSMPSDEQHDNKTSFEMTWFWWTFAASYIFVVAAWAIVLGINPPWCRGLFSIVDAFCLKLYSINIKS